LFERLSGTVKDVDLLAVSTRSVEDRRVRRSRPTIGLVLSGGGSRGAYEAGVLRFGFLHKKGEAPATAMQDKSANYVNANFDDIAEAVAWCRG